ncbi:MAG: glycosyl hydrolase 108 family protein, partial [Pseudomonadota bacterium]
VLSRGSNPALGHVGFLVGATADALFLLGGNQSDQVNVTRFARSRLLGLRLPKTGAEDVAEESSASEADATDARFAQCLAHVLRMEGGYVNDPHDPGGPTNKGVTLATFARHTGTALSDVTRADLITALKAISDADVSAIYRDRYWRVSRAAEMPTGLDLMHFDAAVNHGPTGAVRLLQRALDVEVDGEIGPITLAAARAQSVSAIIAAYAKARRKRYRALPHFWRFGRGWLRRVDATERAARRALQAPQSDQQKGTSDMSSPETAPTALPAPTPPAKWWGQSMTLWGAFITTLATVLPVVGPLFGLNITAGLVEQVGQHVLTILQAIGGISGLVLTVFGRMRATTQLVATPPSRAHRR